MEGFEHLKVSLFDNLKGEKLVGISNKALMDTRQKIIKRHHHQIQKQLNNFVI